MYADTITQSMRAAIDETDRRRAIQARLQHRARDRADDDHQGDPRHQRAAAGRGRVDRRVHAPTARPAATGRTTCGPSPRADREDRGPHGGRHAQRGQEPRVRAGGHAPRRDPADPPAGPRPGRLDHRRPGGRGGAARPAGWLERARARPRPGGRASGPPADRPGPRGDHGRGPAASSEEPGETLEESAPPRPPPTGCRASATSTTTTAAGRHAGSTGRRGTTPSRPNVDQADAASDPGRVRATPALRRAERPERLFQSRTTRYNIASCPTISSSSAVPANIT